MRDLEKGSSMADADGWLTPGRFAAILAGLIFVCFPLVVLGVETFFFRDFGSFGYPLAFYHRESFWRGELPLWNPYNSCGLPFLAQWNTLTLYPPSLFYLIFPLSWSLGMFCLGHLFLGGMGMYFRAHRWTGNRLAAAVAGTIFAFNGLTWVSLMWPNNIAAFGWMPWVLLVCERAWQTGGRRVIVAAIVGAVQMLSGAPEVIFLTWVATSVFWLAEVWREKELRARFAARFIGVIVLVSGLAAIQLLPFMDLLAHSQRTANYGRNQEWAMPLSGFANYLVPIFHMVSDGVSYNQYEQFWTASYYMGATTFALALLAMGRGPRRDWRTWVLAGLLVFSLVMSLGERGGLYALMKTTLPFLGFMRYSIKFVVLGVLVLPLLAAQGVNWVQQLPPIQWPVGRKKIFDSGALFVVLIALIACTEWFFPEPRDDRVGVVENALVRALFLMAILGCLAVLRQVEEVKLQRLLRVSLLMLLWFDIYSHMPNLNPTVDRIVYEPGTPRDFFKWDRELRPGVSRALKTRDAIQWFMFRKSVDLKADVNGRRLALFANYNLLDHAAKADGEYSLGTAEMEELWSNIYWSSNDLSKLEDFIGVAEISNPTNFVDWVARDTFLPMITGGQEPLFLNDKTALHGILSRDFKPAREVFLEPAAQSLVSARQADVKISLKQFEPQLVEAEVDASAPAMIVIAQTFFHSWHAYVDGKPTALWRANYAFQALQTPAGKHQVRLVYEDVALKCGAVISLASLLIAAAGWFLLAGENRITKSPRPHH